MMYDYNVCARYVAHMHDTVWHTQPRAEPSSQQARVCIWRHVSDEHTRQSVTSPYGSDVCVCVLLFATMSENTVPTVSFDFFTFDANLTAAYTIRVYVGRTV